MSGLVLGVSLHAYTHTPHVFLGEDSDWPGVPGQPNEGALFDFVVDCRYFLASVNSQPSLSV